MSRFLAIDIDPSGLFVAAGTARAGKSAVERTFVWEDPELPLTAANAAGLGERFKDALKAAGILPAPVLVGIGRDRVILKELRYPAVPPIQEPNIVRFQAMKELTESPDEVVLDYIAVDGGVGERRATAFVIRKELMGAIESLCTAAGLKLAGVTPRPYAVAAALKRAFGTGAAPAPAMPGEAVAVVHASQKGGEFTVVRGDSVTFTRSIPMHSVAEPQALVGELKRNLTVYGGQFPHQPIQVLYIAEAEVAGHAARLQGVLPLPVHAFDPLKDAHTAVPADAVGRFVGAVGLLAAKASVELPINFASPRQPRAEVDPNRRILLITALACSLLLGIGAIYGYLKLSEASQQVADLTTQKQAVDASLSQLDPDSRRLQAVDDWSKREVVWLDEMYDLFDRFPDLDQSRITSLSGTSLPTDKAGKQVAQAKMELKLGAKRADAVSALVTAFDRENPEKNKFYINPAMTPTGVATGISTSGGFNQLFNLTTMVNHRSPAEFARQATVSPPRGRVEATAAESKTAEAKPADTKSTSGFRPAKLDDDWFSNP